MKNKIKIAGGVLLVVLVAISGVLIWQINKYNKLFDNYSKANNELNTIKLKLVDYQKNIDDLSAELSVYKSNWKLELEENDKTRQEAYDKERKRIFDDIVANNRYSVFDNYLWHGNKKIFNENLVNYIKDDRVEYNKLSGVEEWFRYEENNKLFIFLRGSNEVIGFSLKYYIELDKEKDVAKIQYDNSFPILNSPSILFDPPYSPNKENIYFVKFDDKDLESIYVYNWKNKVETKVLDIPKNETLVSCGEGCWVTSGLISWIDNNHIKVKTFKRAYVFEGPIENTADTDKYIKQYTDEPANEYNLTIK